MTDQVVSAIIGVRVPRLEQPSPPNPSGSSIVGTFGSGTATPEDPRDARGAEHDA